VKRLAGFRFLTKSFAFQIVLKNREGLDSIPSREYKGIATYSRRSTQEITELVYPPGNNQSSRNRRGPGSAIYIADFGRGTGIVEQRA
jgi:hypothetical protein